MSYTPFERARIACYQDDCENAPFASVGGLENRKNMKAPDYIDPCDVEEYMRGYRDMALDLYGEDYETCEFTWTPALTIGENDGTDKDTTDEGRTPCGHERDLD